MFSTVISVCLYCLRLTIYLIFAPCIFNLTSESLFYPEIIPLEEGTGCPLVVNSQFLSNTTFLSNFLNDVFTWECNFRLTYFLLAQCYSYLFLWETKLFLCRSSDSFSLTDFKDHLFVFGVLQFCMMCLNVDFLLLILLRTCVSWIWGLTSSVHSGKISATVILKYCCFCIFPSLSFWNFD